MDRSNNPESAEADGHGQPRNHALTAALIGGAAAATAGAYVAARAWARRHEDGEPRNSVMATALTATEVGAANRPAIGRAAMRPAATEPPVPREPKVAHEPVL